MNIVLLGGRAAGKSSYAVGLYGGLSIGAFAELELRNVHDPVKFLNEGVERLAARKSVGRTDYEGAEMVELTVATTTGGEHRLRIPDRSGEAFKATLNAREWDAGLATDVTDADAVMLFANPMFLDPATATKELAELLPAEANGDGDEIPVPWSPKMTPTDVRMVDVLQEMREIVATHALPVVVVVSAWDVVGQQDWTPTSWLQTRLPLVVQFLETNDKFYPSEYFGVSVQGDAFGDNESPGHDEPDPWDRAWAVDGAGEAVDLCEPLSWLLRQTEAG